MNSFKIVYTSDVHGQLGAIHYPTNTTGFMGLSRLATYLKQQTSPVLYIDNGDILQGSPLMDYARQDEGIANPAALALNRLNAKYITLGNHDFNYGLPYLFQYVNEVDATLLCANVFQDGQPLGESFVVDTSFGIKLGLIGVTTAYVPQWEQPEHIQGLTFHAAQEIVRSLVDHHRQSVDLLVVVYHGGFESDPITKQPLGRATIENEAVAIAAIPGVDVILTGHQHMSVVHPSLTPKLIQPAMNAREFGVVTVTHQASVVTRVDVELVQNHFEEEPSFVEQFRPLEESTAEWLDQPLGVFESDLRVDSALDVRKQPHLLVDWIHELQYSSYQADISVVSLPNEIAGFYGSVSVRDIAATFVFANTVSVLSMSGRALHEALEQTAAYFELHNSEVVTSPAFLVPKVEHYNYDMYQGIEYAFDLTKPVGQRLVRCLFQGKPLDLSKEYTVVCNNYRAAGGGDYRSFETAQVLVEFDQSYFDMAVSFVKKHHPVRVAKKSKFTLITTVEGADPTIR